MIIVSGSTSIKLSEAVAKELNLTLAKTEIKKFPDAETYIRIYDDLKDQDVVLIQNGYPDEKIIELFILQDAIYENGAKSLTTVIPYYGYARQDRQFNLGEGISARCMAGHFEEDTDRIITIDIHTEKILDWLEVDNKNITAMNEIGKLLKERNIDVIISPDKGGIERAKAAAAAADCDFDYLEKKRLDGHTVEMTPLKSEVTGLNIALVDDIISTGGTMVTATRQLKDRGAKSVYAACTHGLFIADAFERLRGVCNEVISTDTLPNPATCVSVAPEIAKCLKELVH